MRVSEALQESALPPIEREILLAATLGKERAWLLAHGGESVAEDQMQKFREWTARRKKHEPIAYILGSKEFYGRTFTVTPDVLIPRPETEEFVEHVLHYLSNGTERVTRIGTDVVALIRRLRNGNPKSIVDVGTGSGCIAITLALETKRTITAVDKSQRALSVARENAKRHSVTNRITFLEGDLLAPFNSRDIPFFLVSNPPYVPEEETPMEDVVDYEPHEAFYAGEEGMRVLHPLVEGACEHPLCLGIALECRAFQAQKLMEIL